MARRWKAPTPTAQAVYDGLMRGPDENWGGPTYLRDSFKRGEADLPAPDRSHRLQFAAWRAGRDYAREIRKAGR